jgi:hypothetical protein
MNGRIPIHAALDIVHPVAIVAGGRHNQSHLQQTTAMNAFQVLGGRLGMAHAVFGRQSGVGMTTRAGLREVEFEDRRSRA